MPSGGFIPITRGRRVEMTDRVVVAATDELGPGEAMAISIDGEGVALFNVDGEYYAIANRCTHVGGSLGKGRLDDGVVTCPLHGAEFDVRTGEVCSPPADESVRTYEVEVVDGELLLHW